MMLTIYGKNRYGPLVQWLERLSHKQFVPGSSPGRPTTLIAQPEVIMRTRPQRTAAYKSQSKSILSGAIGKQNPILVEPAWVRGPCK